MHLITKRKHAHICNDIDHTAFFDVLSNVKWIMNNATPRLSIPKSLIIALRQTSNMF